MTTSSITENSDVEYFLKKNAIEFTEAVSLSRRKEQHIAKSSWPARGRLSGTILHAANICRKNLPNRKGRTIGLDRAEGEGCFLSEGKEDRHEMNGANFRLSNLK